MPGQDSRDPRLEPLIFWFQVHIIPAHLKYTNLARPKVQQNEVVCKRRIVWFSTSDLKGRVLGGLRLGGKTDQKIQKNAI